MEKDMIKISSAKPETNYIAHHGTEGMHWGKRKYQYEDGSLTPLGRIHYGVGEAREKSKIKMREARAASKNEARVIKAKAKAEAMKYKAEAEAYKAKKDAEDETERRRIEADKEMEKNFGKEKTKQTQIEADARVEMNRQQYQPQQTKEKNYTALKVAGGLLAAAGIGYLLYKTFKSGSGGGGNQTFSKEVASKGEDTIKKLENSPASEIAKKGDEAMKSDGKSLGFFARRSAEKQSGKDFGNAALERLEKANKNAELAKKVENAKFVVKRDEVNDVKKATEVASKLSARLDKGNKESIANATKNSAKMQSEFAKLFTSKIGSDASDINRTNYNVASTMDRIISKYGESVASKKLQDEFRKLFKHSDEFMEGYVLIHSANPDVCHHGVKGQRWGLRRWQYEDGTLTPEGRVRYGRRAEIKARKSQGYENISNETLALRPLQTLAGGVQGASVGAMIGASTQAGAISGAVFGGPIGALAAFTTMSAVSFIAKKLSQRNERKANELIKKAEDESVKDFIKEQAKTENEPSKENPDYTNKEVAELKKQGYKFLDPEEDPQENRRGPFKYENLKEFAEKDPEGYAKSEVGKAEIKGKLTRAKSQDKWDLNFMETVQNDSRNENVSWLLKEYEKYLTNPRKYMTTFTPKE